MLSFTGHYAKAFSFDFDYTHVEATCTDGEMWNLEVEGQPRDTTMQFEKGKNVYWTPSDEIEKIPQKTEITLKVYNNKTQLHKCTVIFECVSRDISAAEFEIYLKDSDGLKMMYYDGKITFVEQSSISNVGGADNPNSIITEGYPKDIFLSTLNHFQVLYEETPAEQVEEKITNGELVIKKMHYYNTKKEWCADGYTYKYRLEITGRLNNAVKDSTFIVLSNKEDITFEQTWKASGLSSLSTDYFKPEEAVIVGHKLFS